MSSHPEEQPYSHSHLDSPEYRKRLLRKLNTLIAVLEVACAKVRRSLEGPNPDVQRLSRIQSNLRETLQVCMRAKRALERSEQGAEKPAAQLPPAAVAQPAMRGELAAHDLASHDEQQKFLRLGPIDLRDVRACDLDALCRELMADGLDRA
jgi:hypothetical protein